MPISKAKAPIGATATTVAGRVRAKAVGQGPVVREDRAAATSGDRVVTEADREGRVRIVRGAIVREVGVRPSPALAVATIGDRARKSAPLLRRRSRFR